MRARGNRSGARALRAVASLLVLLVLAGVAGTGSRAWAQQSGAVTISQDDAKRIAAQTVEGEVIDVEVERKLGGKRYVVEVIRKSDGAEVDVIIEMETGKVLAVED